MPPAQLSEREQRAINRAERAMRDYTLSEHARNLTGPPATALPAPYHQTLVFLDGVRTPLCLTLDEAEYEALLEGVRANRAGLWSLPHQPQSGSLSIKTVTTSFRYTDVRLLERSLIKPLQPATA